MEVGILGPVAITESGAPVAVEAPKERAVVAALALQAGSPVPASVLIEALWGDDPPPTAEKTLQSHISKLRRLMGAEFLVGEPSGYVLDIDPESVDVHRFECFIDAGTEALLAGDIRSAAARLREALDLWRGEPLTDLADDSDLRLGQSARLAELRLLATERRIEAALAMGNHADTVAELRSLVTEYPFRESLWGHLMLALYRSGRQAEALRSYQQLRQVLGEELGIEPSAPIVRLEHRILRQDPQLDLEPPPPPQNLPSTLSSFVGRLDDVREVTQLVGDHRLVTLVGPGGVGKTRLALEAARNVVDSYGDGVWWIDLAAVRDPAAVPGRVAAALGATQVPGTSVLDSLTSFVRNRELLLIVDNCEHMVEAVSAMVAHLLEGGPDIAVVATSRVPLHVPGEIRRPVDPLDVPPDDTAGTDLSMFDSVRLFSDRAAERAAPPLDDDSLAVVAEICRHLDGIPLAIELAAARSVVVDPNELLKRLTHRLDALAGDTTREDPRYHSLRAALDWSYGLLDDRERRVFDRLAVFPGDFDLQAAEDVVVGGAEPAEILDILHELVEASMVMPVSGDTAERRFRLLETMTEYGLEHLHADELEDVRERHGAHYREIARKAGAAGDTAREGVWLARLEREDHNMRAAIAWSLENEPRSSTLVFANAIGLAWFLWGSFAECETLLETVLEDDDGSEPGLRGWVLYRLLFPALLSGRPERALEALQEAVALAHATDDKRLTAILSFMQAHMLLLGTGDSDAAMPHYAESLALCEEHDLAFEKVWPILGTAQALVLADRTDGLAEMLDEAERILADTSDHYRLAHLYMVRCLLSWALDDLPACQSAAIEGIRHSRLGHTANWEQANLAGLGVALVFDGDRVAAEGYLLQAARLALDDGNLLQVGIPLQGLAALAALQHRPVVAARLLGASTTVMPWWPLMARRYGPMLDRAREELGDRFDAEVEGGARLTPEEAVALALSGHLD